MIVGNFRMSDIPVNCTEVIIRRESDDRVVQSITKINEGSGNNYFAYDVTISKYINAKGNIMYINNASQLMINIFDGHKTSRMIYNDKYRVITDQYYDNKSLIISKEIVNDSMIKCSRESFGQSTIHELILRGLHGDDVKDAIEDFTMMHMYCQDEFVYFKDLSQYYKFKITDEWKSGDKNAIFYNPSRMIEEGSIDKHGIIVPVIKYEYLPDDGSNTANLNSKTTVNIDGHSETYNFTYVF